MNLPQLTALRQRDSTDPVALLARLLAPYIAEAIGVQVLPATAEYDLSQSPAGKRRAHSAARSGEIKGAKKRLRKWYCRPSDHDDWLETITIRPTRERPTEEPSEAAPSSLDELRARLGLRRIK